MNLRSWLLFIVWMVPAVARLPALRDSDHVGEKDPGEGRRLGRGSQTAPCDDAAVQTFLGVDPCGFQDGPEVPPPAGSTYCTWYGGFSEYECGCDSKKTLYCKDADVMDCIDGYEPTQMTLNGGRVFWSCTPTP